ncbi:hypothetical protein FANTH_1394 [Fusarium anthophilum]|uniref:Heterokaryon incompatibility domain-containing protein n=1 Tax=Fusarium anthophilum TaxID=48485 RepID=A0A8H5EBB9_9HYPO|nr:hypothetical protein FANTH_1394 [Fusarium anthophilum]
MTLLAHATISVCAQIIDVDDADEGIVYLRERAEVNTSTLGGESKPGDYPAYWTLSHRWGDPDLIQQLSQTTKDQFRSGMALSSLSPTFRDAALLVRRMGFRYIWIDSLCIFQDSLIEWQQEAKAMVDIYRHSFCNISAIAASSDPSSTGLFSKRSLPSRHLFPFIIREQHLEDKTGFDIGPWLLYNDSSWNDEIENTPLNTRGWVVQERFLAPRVLHFTKDQMYWECLETTVCEADPDWKLQILPKDDRLRQPIQTVYKAAGRQIVRRVSNLQTNQGLGAIGLEKTYYTLWGSIVSIYANCALTKESDRLIAMSGIAKRFQEASKDTYLAGLWKEVIHSDLTWKTNAIEGAEVVRNESYAPTWSWASVVGGHTTLSALHQRYSGLPQPLMTLVEDRIITEPPGGDPTGLLRSAELDIECMLFYYRWTGPSTTLAVYKDDIRSDCYFEEDFSSQSLQLDTTDLVRKFKELEQVEGVCVPLCAGYYGYGGGRNVFMMLDLVSGTTFRRIGTFEHGGIEAYQAIKAFKRKFNSTANMKTTAILMIAAFASSVFSLEVKDASTPGGGTPGSPACNRQCLITISPGDGASTQRSDGFPGSCKEYATGQLKGTNRAIDGGRLNINGVGGNLVIDFVKNGRDRRASFTNCKEAVFTGAQCSLKQGGCDKQAESG